MDSDFEELKRVDDNEEVKDYIDSDLDDIKLLVDPKKHVSQHISDPIKDK